MKSKFGPFLRRLCRRRLASGRDEDERVYAPASRSFYVIGHQTGQLVTSSRYVAPMLRPHSPFADRDSIQPLDAILVMGLIQELVQLPEGQDRWARIARGYLAEEIEVIP